SSCQRWNKLPRPKGEKWKCFRVIWQLMQRDEDAKDPVIPFMTWLALEPSTVTFDAFTFLVEPVEMLTTYGRLAGEEHPFVRYHIVPRMLRRWASSTNATDVAYAVMWPRFAKDAKACAAYLDGILEGLKGRRFQNLDAWTFNRDELNKEFKNHNEV